jgi:prepilin peptidase CpaA
MLASIFFFILLELLVVSYADMMYKKIKNIWSLLNITTYIIFIFIFPSDYFFNFKHWLYPSVFLGVGFFLFVIKIMGGGDAKFLASLFLLVPSYLQDKFLLLLLYSTVFVGLTMFLYNCYTSRDILKQAWAERSILMVKGVFGTRFTYAPVILIAWIWLGWEFLQVSVKGF